jgi:hypothetical protein
MWNDAIIDEIHQIRQEYAEKFNFDVDAIVKDLQHQQTIGTYKIVSFVDDSALRENDLREAFAEVEAHKRGEIVLPTLSEFLAQQH